MSAKVPRVRTSSAGPFIAARKSFTNHSGSLRGDCLISGSGRLDQKNRDQWIQDWDHIYYVVYSYDTPIAWHTSKPKGCGCCQDERWYIVDQKFSTTTSKHQGQLWQIRQETQDGLS